MSNPDRIWYYCVYIFNHADDLSNGKYPDEKWNVMDNEDGRAVQDVIDLINEREIYRSKEGKETHAHVIIKSMKVVKNDESI